MNKKILIVFLGAVIVIIGVPFLATLKQQLQGTPPSVANTQKPEVPSPTPTSNLLESPQPTSIPSQLPSPIPMGPPDFTGSVWQVNTPYGAVQVQLNPGGQAIASHPMVGTITGTWRQVGNQMFITANIMGQTYNISAEICGNTLCYQGRPITRLR